MKGFGLVLCFWLCGIIPSFSQCKTVVSGNDDSLHRAPPALKFSAGQLYFPGILVASGALLDISRGVKNTQRTFYTNHLSPFHTPVDNYLQYVPAIIPYGLDALGVHSRTDIANRTVILIKAELLLNATGFLLKHAINEQRPDGSNHYSFPSGHTMQVFATATMLSEEYGYKYKWVPYAAYTFASGVGALRVANNKHYIGDVLVGAGLGILSMKVSYWLHQYKWNKHKRVENHRK